MALAFPGSTSTAALQVTSGNGLDTPGPMTYAVWFYMTAAADGTSRRIWNKNLIEGSSTGVAFISNAANGLRFHTTAWTTTQGQFGVSVPAPNMWHHLFVSYAYTNTTDVPIFMIDGVQQTVTTVQSPVGTVGGSDTNTLFIGNSQAFNQAFNGGLADFAWWAEALPPSAGQKLALGRQKGGALPSDIEPNFLKLYAHLDIGSEMSVAPYNQPVVGVANSGFTGFTGPQQLTIPRPRRRSINSVAGGGGATFQPAWAVPSNFIGSGGYAT